MKRIMTLLFLFFLALGCGISGGIFFTQTTENLDEKFVSDAIPVLPPLSTYSWKTMGYTTITLNKNGGTGGSNYCYKVTYENMVLKSSSDFSSLIGSGTSWLNTNGTSSFDPFTISMPSKTGYTFLGYYTSYSGGTQTINASGKVTASVYDYTSNSTWYARWSKKEYLIDVNILNPDGEQDYKSGTMTYYSNYTGNTYYNQTDQPVDALYNNGIIKISNIQPATGMVLESVHNTGGTAKGTLSESGGVYTYTLTYSGTPSGSWDDEITIQMAWENYTITLNANGGDSVPGFSYNMASTTTLPGTIKKGHDFNGWKPSSSSGNWYSSTTYSAGTSVNGKYGSVTLNAQWTPYNWGIEYYNNHTPSDNTFASQGGYKYGTHVGINHTPQSNIGYTFIGWNTKRDGTGINCLNTSSIENQIKRDGEYIRLYAIWRNNKYYVRYNANVSGRGVDSNCQSSDLVIGTMSNSTHYYDISSNLSNNVFTRRGYSFQGWSTNYNATSKTYNNQHSISTLSSKDEATVDLYAIWKRNSYTISFNANGGSGETSPLTMLYNSGNKTLPKCGYSRPGYLFEGWTTNPDGTGTIYKDCATVNSYDYISNVTLYAKWKATWMADVMTRTTPLKGSGTQTAPYKIETAEDLAYLSRLVQEGNAFSVGASQQYFEQTAPIDLSGKIWSPIGGSSLGSSTTSFGGVYNGKGFAIMGLETYSQTDASGNYLYNCVGLFGRTSGAKLMNVYVLNANVKGKNNVGALVGENVDKNLVIYGCLAKGVVNGISNVGGLVGNDKVAGLQINNSGFAGTVTGGNIMVGTMSGGIIQDCYAEVDSNMSFFGSGEIRIDACVYETSSGKYYYSDKTTKNGINFEGWTTYQGKPLPSGLTWIGGVSTTGATLDGYTPID